MGTLKLIVAGGGFVSVLLAALFTVGHLLAGVLGFISISLGL